MFSMKPKHLIPILLCLCLLLAAPAVANETSLNNPPKVIYIDYSDEINEILASNDNPTKKLERMCEVMGYDDRLEAWHNSYIDAETGERVYEMGLVESILDFFGIAPEPYTEEEAELAHNQYMTSYLVNYKSTGGFGEPIA